MKNPYKTLGVPNDAGHEAIKQAYRRLAMELHPDRNPEAPEVADKFKDVNAAYALIGDPDKRARFDRGDIDAWGRRRPKPPNPPKATNPNTSSNSQSSSKPKADKPSDAPSRPKPEAKKDRASIRPSMSARKPSRTKKAASTGWLGGAIKADDLLGPLKTATSRRSKHNAQPLPDPNHKLRVTFLEAAHGVTKRLTTGRGRTLEVNVPPGIRDGQVIRLKDQGDVGPWGGRSDALVKIDVTPHKVFRTDGDDVHLEVPITLEEAILGARIRVPTVDGSVEVSVPSGANSGAQLRLRGKGLRRPGHAAAGDQVIRLVIKLPQTIDPSLKAFVREQKGRSSFDPRQNLASA